MKTKSILETAHVLLTIGLLVLSLYLIDRLNKAESYIFDLESDYPEYIDTTSGRDSYSEWYQ